MIGRGLPVLVLILSLTACAAPSTRPLASPPVHTAAIGDSTPAWRTCYFRTSWPEGEPPRWAVDLLVAHRILGPILAEQGQDLQFWRFNRRAARDQAGHHLRFLFYTDSTRAADIINSVQQNEVRSKLLENRVLQSVNCQSPNDMSQPRIGDTSDPAWPETIQNHWPAYIMGISQMWLGLIEDATQQIGPPAADIAKLLEQYTRANEIVTTLWHVEGEHVFLHHLSGIFGYQPLHINF